MLHKACSSIEEVPYCFPRSSVKFQGHAALKIIEFDPNWAFPDCNSSLESPIATKWCIKLEVALKRCPIVFQGHPSNFKFTQLLKIFEFDPNWAFPDCNSSLKSPMAMKCCTKLETTKERWPIVFQGHPSNFKVTRDKTSRILTQIGRFLTIGWSQLSNPSDLPCFGMLRDFTSFTSDRGHCCHSSMILVFGNCRYFHSVILLLKTKTDMLVLNDSRGMHALVDIDISTTN